MPISGWTHTEEERRYRERAKAADRVRHPGPFRQIGNIWRARTGRGQR